MKTFWELYDEQMAPTPTPAPKKPVSTQGPVYGQVVQLNSKPPAVGGMGGSVATVGSQQPAVQTGGSVASIDRQKAAQTPVQPTGVPPKQTQIPDQWGMQSRYRAGVIPRTPYEIIDGLSEERAYDYIGRISDDQAKKIDPRGKQGLLDYLVNSLKERKTRQPRQFPWNTPQQKPQKDWEAIESFLNTVNFRKGINVKRALEYPDMVNESISGNVTVTNLTPELKASLESQGFKFKTWDEKLFPNMNKLGEGRFGTIETGSGVEALNAFEKLKSLGAQIELQRFKNVSYR